MLKQYYNEIIKIPGNSKEGSSYLKKVRFFYSSKIFLIIEFSELLILSTRSQLFC